MIIIDFHLHFNVMEISCGKQFILLWFDSALKKIVQPYLLWKISCFLVVLMKIFVVSKCGLGNFISVLQVFSLGQILCSQSFWKCVSNHSPVGAYLYFILHPSERLWVKSPKADLSRRRLSLLAVLSSTPVRLHRSACTPWGEMKTHAATARRRKERELDSCRLHKHKLIQRTCLFNQESRFDPSP